MGRSQLAVFHSPLERRETGRGLAAWQGVWYLARFLSQATTNPGNDLKGADVLRLMVDGRAGLGCALPAWWAVAVMLAKSQQLFSPEEHVMRAMSG